jgi:hypothetical protein
MKMKKWRLYTGRSSAGDLDLPALARLQQQGPEQREATALVVAFKARLGAGYGFD